jgi:phosphohistidine phosphatase
MDIYLLRHAEAEEQRPGGSDGERALTEKGWQQAQRAAAWLKAQGIEVEAIVSSPLLRAVQTAQPVAEALGKAVVTDKRVAGLRLTAQAVGEIAREYEVGESLLLVGHEPDMSDLIAELTRGQVEVKKAALALVSCEPVAPGGGVLRWLVPGKMQIS